MKKDILSTIFPSKKWMRQDWLHLGVLFSISIILLLAGLSVRSLWGSEGRWAEIAREMIMSGNYFLPTINGLVYFDKPLLSYWAIIPFAINGIVTETSARMPGALAGIGAVIITFLIGRRLFGNKIGFVSSLLLLTSVMFILWSRTASAEMLNLFSIWLSFWFFISGANRGNTIYVIFLYSICAFASFLKGPVAPAVVFFSITFYSVLEAVILARKNNFTSVAFKDALFLKLQWIISWQGFFGVLTGAAIFTILMLIPVIFTGSWSSAELMWKENVQRFFRPFDHIEPFYVYFKHIPLFFAPWTILMLSCLWSIKYWEKNMPERLIIFITMAIFLFFTISGSRRSYYILPILPGLALITGKALTDWLSINNESRQRPIRFAAISTCFVLLLFGLGIIYVYFDKSFPSHFSQLAIGVFAFITGIISIVLFYKNIPKKGLAIVVSIVFIVELWGFTVGMSLAEKNRTLRPFALKVSKYVNNVSDDKISLFQGYDSAFVFYLKRGPLKKLSTAEEVKLFKETHPDGFLVANLSSMLKFQQEGSLDGMSVIITEKDHTGKHKDNLALFSFRN